MNIFLILTTAILFSSLALGKSDFPAMTVLASNEGESTLEMNCDSIDKGETVHCKFTQKSIRTSKFSKEEIEKEISGASKKDKETAIKNLKKRCEESEKVKKSNFVKNSYEDRDMQNAISLCECVSNKGNEECLIAMMRNTAELKSKVCKIGTNSFEYELKRISKNKWMNTPTPSVLCKVVTAITLERKSEYKWIYTQTRLSADTDNPLCALDVNKPVIYESSTSYAYATTCEFIDLGPNL